MTIRSDQLICRSAGILRYFRARRAVDVRHREPENGLIEPTPIMRRLTARQLAPADMADVLERYIGDDVDPERCKEALVSLRRLRREHPGFYLRATLRLLDEDREPRACLKKIIALLRKFSRVALR